MHTTYWICNEKKMCNKKLTTYCILVSKSFNYGYVSSSAFSKICTKVQTLYIVDSIDWNSVCLASVGALTLQNLAQMLFNRF